MLASVERSLFQVSKPAFQSQSLKIVCAVGYTLCRVPVDSGVCKLMIFSNVIVDIIISHRLFVFSQSCVEVPASLSDVGGVAVRVLDLVNRSLSVVRFVLVFNVSQ